MASVASPAHAESISKTANGGTVTGTFSAQNNVVKWNLTIKDTSADGGCVYLEINPDLDNHTDPDLGSASACGVGDTATFSGSRTYVNLNGVRLKICNSEGIDHCEQVGYNINDQT